MSSTHNISVKLVSDTGPITVSSLPSGTIVKHGDEVIWTVTNADQWELSISFNGDAGLRPSDIVGELVLGASQKFSRTVKSPFGTGTYNDDYFVTLKYSKESNDIVEINETSYLAIERSVEPTGGEDCPPCRPCRGQESNASYPGAAGTPDPARAEQRLGG